MGLFRTLYSVVNRKVLGEETISTVEKSFKKQEQTLPNEDLHILLAETWLRGMSARGKNVHNETMQMTAMDETTLFACIPPPFCAKALGIYILKQENPDIVRDFPEFLHEFNQIMMPVFEAQESGTFEKLYTKYNPKLALS